MSILIHLNKKRILSESGFNLVEIMVAIVIFALTITAVIYAQAQAGRRFTTTKEETMASILAQKIMAETEARVEVMPAQAQAKTEAGEGEGAFAAYKWKWTLDEIPLELPSLDSLTPKSEDNDEEVSESDETMGKMLVDFLNQHLKETLRELTVEVSWVSNVDNSEKKFTLTTHVVDLLKKPSFGGLNANPAGGGGTGDQPPQQ